MQTYAGTYWTRKAKPMPRTPLLLTCHHHEQWLLPPQRSGRSCAQTNAICTTKPRWRPVCADGPCHSYVHIENARVTFCTEEGGRVPDTFRHKSPVRLERALCLMRICLLGFARLFWKPLCASGGYALRGSSHA